jgi:glycerate 2-kinase
MSAKPLSRPLPLRNLLERSFSAAVDAADPKKILANYLPKAAQLARYRRIVVVGAGKAAGSMAAAVENALPNHSGLEGVVITRYGHALPTNRIKVVEAGHPVPDAAGLNAAKNILALAQSLNADDLLLVLVSGGGSSLLALPVESVPMTDLQTVTQQLLTSGAPIDEMNIVRKHLSQIQGGRLAQATQAQVIALVISDVAGDDLSAIASGPCAPDPSRFQDALDVLGRWQVVPPASVAGYLTRGVQGLVSETPKPGDRLFKRVQHQMIATAHQSLEAGAMILRQAGYRTVILGDTITGEARDVAQVLAALTREILTYNQPFSAPVALISGGECTVTIKPASGSRSKPRGGRCSEFLLAFAQSIGSQTRVSAIAADTDGIDGSETNAGAILLNDTLARASSMGISPRQMLDNHDAFGFFEAVGGLIQTGATLTNVNDYRVILIS